MKHIKSIIVFIILIFINLLLDFLLFNFNKDEFQNGDILTLVVLYCFSLFVYWFFIFIYKCSEILMGKSLIQIFAFVFSGVSIIIMMINVRNEPILFMPLMFIDSVFASSFYWEFLRMKNK